MTDHPTTGRLDPLPPAIAAEVLAAVAAVETADRPVPRTGYRALAEAPLRAVVEACLEAAGRTLVAVGDGYLSGYDDAVAERLAQEGVGVLPPDDRAVLTAVLLLSVAMPRAAGRLPADTDWTCCEVLPANALDDMPLRGYRIKAAVHRLREAGILGYGNDPARGIKRGIALGPQFARLTPAVGEALFEELVLLAEPDGLYAETIRRHRAAARPDNDEARG